MRLKDGFHGQRSIVLPAAIIDLMSADPLASLIYITDIGYYPHALHHYRRRDEPISQYVFIYCVKGSGWYEVSRKNAGAPPVHHEVHQHQYFILPAEEAHAYGSDDADPWTIYWIHFTGTVARHYAATTSSGIPCYAPQDVSPTLRSRISDRNNLFEEIFSTLSASLSIESIRYAMASFHHYLASLRYISRFRSVGPDAPDASLEQIVTHYFSENIERTLTLREIADYTGISTSSLSAKFKTLTGHSPLSYFSLMKIRRACDLLDNTALTVSQISHKLGIDDPYYFSRLFSRTMGCSPRAYRSRTRP